MKRVVSPANRQPPTAMNRPNFILLIGEDAGRALGCYGDPDAKTPNLDRLAAEGCRYDNAFSTAPVCAPSRCALVTGQYAWSIGTHHMRSTLLSPPPVFTELLRKAGYYVNWENKTDFNFEPPETFADECKPWLDDLRNDRLPDKPFFLYHNFNVTHESTMWAKPWDGRGAVGERLENRHLLSPDQQVDPATVRVPAYLPDTPEVRANIARFYEALAIEDRKIGDVLDAIDNSPHRDNTIVIYLTDHGRGLIREKRWLYGAGIHLSLVIRWPKGIKPGSVSDEMVSWVDVAPTLLSLAGVDKTDAMHGRVFLGSQQGSPRQYVFAGRDRMDEAFDRCRAVRDKRWHYIRNYFPQLPYCQRNQYMENMETVRVLREMNARGELTDAQRLWMSPTKPAEELYDALVDRDMVHNLAADPAYADTLARMRRALDDELARHGDLGEIPERELINRGLVKDRLGEYGAWIEPLPEHLRVGVERSVLEMPQ